MCTAKRTVLSLNSLRRTALWCFGCSRFHPLAIPLHASSNAGCRTYTFSTSRGAASSNPMSTLFACVSLLNFHLPSNELLVMLRSLSSAVRGTAGGRLESHIGRSDAVRASRSSGGRLLQRWQPDDSCALCAEADTLH